MVNYQQAKIYRIISNQTDKVYIGATCNPLSKRMADHRSAYRYCLTSGGPRMTSFEILQYDDAIIVLVEDCPCENIEQLRRCERAHIENTPHCVNKQHPGRTIDEWREANKEELVIKRKAHYEANKEAVIANAKVYYEANRDEITHSRRQHYEANKEDFAARQKEYYAANRETLIAKQKLYTEANKETISERQKQVIECECGCKSTRGGIKAHRNTKKHDKCMAAIAQGA